MSATTTEINTLGARLAEINADIVTAGASGGTPPPDLLDRRDQLLADLAALVQVDAVEQRDGTMAVFIGSGQPLVLGTNATSLAVVPGSLDPAEPQIVMRGSGPDIELTRFLTGGELGGLLDFNREMLVPARAELGRIAVGLADAVNTAHRNGMDLFGQLGGDLLATAAPQTYEGSGNTGTGALAVSIVDVGGLEATNYRLSYDGASYTLLRADNGAVVPLTGTGTVGDPLVADGLSIVVSGAAAAGDQFTIKALEHVAGTMSVLVSDPARIAAAAPIRTSAALGNAGNANISSGSVVDVTHPSLLATTTIEFLTPGTYSVNGAGSFAYTSGNDIVVNGARVRLSGTTVAGDQFVIESNAGGVGDNRNALALAAALGGGVLAGGNLTLQSAASGLVTNVGTRSAEAKSQGEAQRVVVSATRDRLESIRGVNLDEEAADMLKFEQMYQAAAQMISVADNLFNTLLLALRR
jgi:flagellar hook-associated protein 1 FlgK